MTGSNASEDIEQRVKRLAEASQRKRPDVSQYPGEDTKNDAWPDKQVPAKAPAGASPRPAPSPEVETRQPEPAPDSQAEPQTTTQQPEREAAATPDAEIDTLLEAARANLARDRLTTPAGANALEGFQAVLALDPDNKEATSGLEAIVTRYVALARRVARSGRFDKAESFLQRAERAGVSEEALSAARVELTEMRANQ